MYQEGRLFMGQLQAVVEGPGDGAGDHAAEGAGGEHHDAQQPGEQRRRPLGADDAPLFDHDVHKALDAAGALDHVDQGADEQHGQQHNGVAAAGEGVHQAVEGVVEAHDGVEAAQDEAGQENTDEQGDKHVFQHQRQHDGDQRGNDGPDSILHMQDLLKADYSFAGTMTVLSPGRSGPGRPGRSCRPGPPGSRPGRRSRCPRGAGWAVQRWPGRPPVPGRR